MSPPSPRFRERAPRVPLHGRVVVHVEGCRSEGVTGNVSETGMLLYVGLPLAPGSRLRLHFPLPGQKRWVDLYAVVVHQSTDCSPFPTGVRFVRLSPNVSAQLDAYIASREGPSARDRAPAEEVSRRLRLERSALRRQAAPVVERRRPGALDDERLLMAAPIVERRRWPITGLDDLVDDALLLDDRSHLTGSGD